MCYETDSMPASSAPKSIPAEMSRSLLQLSSHLAFLLLALLAPQLDQAASYGTLVKNLPGFDGNLPFKLETGYVSLEASELFYYFVESEGDPRKDPLLLWYSGGPGCSALNGLIYQIGPLAFDVSAYQGGVPPISYYPHSWTKSSSILFVDAPVGTGFSYATDPSAYPMSDTKSAAQTYEFLRQWLIEHPQFLKLQLFIGADSYSGISAPLVVKHVVNGNKAGAKPYLNLKGYIVGCPRTDAAINENSKISFSHRIGLISDELFEATRETCDSSYTNVEPENWRCLENLKLVRKLIKDINKNQVLEPKCQWADPDPGLRRSMKADNNANLFQSGASDFWCHNLNYSMSDDWANAESVQQALNVRQETVQEWARCNKSLDYDEDVASVVDVHKSLSKLGLQALIYNGDHDLTIPSCGTQEWIRKLNLSVVNEWRPWLVNGQVVGYTVKYSNRGFHLTYASVLAAGHPPQEYKRRECFDMYERWIHYYPL
uniref:Serine carboxypeptidase-like 18 n=2 Tax=Kalanchoe fedtschenkoi TaxID=63787 RepID=A0A7N0T126_KALFE